VDVQEQQAAGGPAFVVHVDGEVAADGSAIALHIVRGGEAPVDICLCAEDVQYLVSILLALSCEAKRLRPDDVTPPKGAIPLPLGAISVGQDDLNQTFLMLEVGGAAMMVGVPAAALQEIGQTLLALSAGGDGKPS